jgi:hypothetical protein
MIALNAELSKGLAEHHPAQGGVCPMRTSGKTAPASSTS